MNGHASATTAIQPARRARIRAALGTPSMRAAITVFITLLILFRWLHLILALQIASTGRQIQIRTAEIQVLERGNALLRKEIAAEASPRKLSERGETLDYRPTTPTYLPVDQPLLPTEDSAATGQIEDESQPASSSLWDVLAHGLAGWQESGEPER